MNDPTSRKGDGGPAFPFPVEDNNAPLGMSLRNWYKGMALAGIMGDIRYSQCGNEPACAYEVSRYAGKLADALIEEDLSQPAATLAAHEGKK